MATKQEIEFTINPDGSVEIHPVGFKGKKCTEVTKEIEEALGIVKNVTYSSEYYQQEEEVHTTVKVGSDK
ncbi:MAG: DUF2997 domain-containing protein [Proteobacteria bacterium]|nr:DUF2997 domain-containing protein [Pseudomonadota bacterium]MBR4985653.1 DUF2997 domain-containing protein [Pseudomonadota bacterium]